MAKKRITATARRTRQQSALDKNTSNSGSDRQSASSSPSPECHFSSSSSSPTYSALSSRQQSPMPLHRGRKKSTPVRSPDQGDTSKAVVLTNGYNKNDPSLAVDMAMAMDVAILPSLPPYAQQQSRLGTFVCTTPSRHHQQAPSLSSDVSITTTTQAIMTRNDWTSDPSLYRTKSVVDLSRNLLILHSRRPGLALAPSTEAPNFSFHPYARTHTRHSSNRPSLSRSSSHSLASTPSLAHSSPPSPSSSTVTTPSLISSAEEKSTLFLSSSSSSSSSSPPLTPTDPVPPSLLVEGAGLKGEDLCLASSNSESLPFPSRLLNVRGLGVQGRRMQVILV
ncbi:hypothetical protein BG003_005355 [Podila horticola]|nr:hypothetical protein BG003_005355 [Podila horticola]